MRTTITSVLSLLAIVVASAISKVGCAEDVAPGAKFEALFDGNSLDGWDGDPRFWRVVDGAIVGETSEEVNPEQNTFLIHRGGEYDDFELRLSYQVEGFNSGVQYRSVDEGNWVVSGYQCDFEAQWHKATDKPDTELVDKFSGMFFDEKGRMFMAQRGEVVVVRNNPENVKKPLIEKLGSVGDATELGAHIKRDDWNELVVIAKDNQFTHLINGHVMAMGIDEDTVSRRASGLFAFQLHKGPPMKIRLKDIRVRRLNPEPNVDDGASIGNSETSSGGASLAPSVFRKYEQFALRHSGDAANGKRLFHDQRTKCVVCHTISGEGGEVGVDLSRIGGKFDRPHLIESLLEPSRQIVEGYRTTNILTTSGRVVSGIVRRQDETRITIIDAAANKHTISRADIDELSHSDVSTMPEGLAKELSVDEFADLIAYLESLRTGVQEKMGSAVGGAVSLPDGFQLQTVATGIDGATALEVLPDGRVLVCEQPGRVRVVENGKLLSKPFVTLPVDSNWERGVIGVTHDPGFPKSPYIYVCWVAKAPYPHHRISRFTMEGNVAVAGSEKLLLAGDDQTKMGGNVPAGHQGGALHFGNDGKLYVGIGEQTAGAPSQDLDTFLGKILRINPDGSIPKDNPFFDVAKGKYQAIWALGCRNPFTFAFRKSDGHMLINDVGGEFEEINVGSSGANYGWPVVEHGEKPEYKTAKYHGPIYSYKQSSLNGGDFCAVGNGWPQSWQGRYFFADFVQGWIRTIDPGNPGDAREFVGGIRRPVDMRFAPDGSLYILLRNAWVIDGKFEGGTGSLLQIRPTSNEPLVPAAKVGSKNSTSAAAVGTNGSSNSHSGRNGAADRGDGSSSVVRLTETVDESAGNLPAFRIETPAAVYFLEKSGGGLSSLLDRDGNDWLSFHPESGSGAGGEYRGFPNAVFHQGGNYFHAKNSQSDSVTTKVEKVTADYVSILVESENHLWQCRYEFNATHCTFSMTKMPEEKKYWVLYEGTPGGELQLDDWWMTSAVKTPQPISVPHEGDIPAPEWIAFGDSGGNRSVLLLNHSDDSAPDTHYQMHQKMTVFGFGRQKMNVFYSSLGQRFSIGLVESGSHADLSIAANQRLASADEQSERDLSIDVWYGKKQRFGHNGNPQRWINVLGRLTDYSPSTELEYSLNGGNRQSLSIGPNGTRLANPGDFNIEIDRKGLSLGENQVDLFASDGTNAAMTSVLVEYSAPDSTALPLRVDWSQASRIQDVAQVTDGLWKLTPEGVRVVEPYYDRVLAIGDESWTDYEVTVPVTFHGFRKPGANDGGRNVVHAAIAVRWPGHHDEAGNHEGERSVQPRTKWYPLGATAEFMIQKHPDSCRWRILGGGGKVEVEDSGRKIEFGRRYMLKHRVESGGGKTTIYRVKFWDAKEPEPVSWNVTAKEESDVAHGGALLLAHYSDVTFGNVLVAPIDGATTLRTVRSVSDSESLGPKPGDVYREYRVDNGGNLAWRVTDPNAKAEGAQQFLPNPILAMDIGDLEHAIRAEAVLDRWGGHAGTADKRIRFNSGEWLTLPELTTTPVGHAPERYHSQDNPVFAIPLEHLVEGANRIEGTVGPNNKVHWGQWGLYSLVLRVYYEPSSKHHSFGSIVSPESGAVMQDNPRIEVHSSSGAEKVDVLAWYEGYDEDGDGVFQDWHGSYFQPERGQPAELRDHVGSIDPSAGTPDTVWNTHWVPDQQKGSIKLVARIQAQSGLTFVTDVVEGLSLHRENWSVKQYRATEVPEAFSVRVGQSKTCTIPIEAGTILRNAKEAVVHYRTWEADDRHHKPFQLNGYSHHNEGKNHHYDYDLLPIPVSELRVGDNKFTIESDTVHHMLEVLWPGPAITVRYQLNPES